MVKFTQHNGIHVSVKKIIMKACIGLIPAPSRRDVINERPINLTSILS